MQRSLLILTAGLLMLPAVQAAVIPGPTEAQASTIITEAPEGTLTRYTKHGEAWEFSYDFGMPGRVSSNGYVAEVTVTDDGKIYMAPVFTFGLSGMGMTYIAGDIKDGKASFTFPQCVYGGTDGTDAVYALLMEWEDDEQGFWKLVPCAEQTLQFDIAEDGTMTPVKDLTYTWIASAVWGTTEESPEESVWTWNGMCGDWYTSLTPLTAVPAQFPEGVTPESWTLIDDTNAYEVKIAIDGNDIYLAGIYNKMPDAVIAGKIFGTTVRFPSVNYLGIYEKDFYTVYAMSVKSAIINHPDYGMIDGFVPDGKNIQFAYDAKAGSLTGKSIIGLSYVEENCLEEVAMELDKVIIEKASDKEITEIAAPVIKVFTPYKDNLGFSAIMFSISNIANDNIFIPENRIFFSIYANGEVYEFDPEDYPCFAEPTSVIPYKFVDETWLGAFEYDETYQMEMVGLTFDGCETVGVQSIYRDGEKELLSEVVTIPADKEYWYTGGDAGVINVDEDAVAPRYFDLYGREVKSPRSGSIVICRTGSASRVIKF